MMNRLLLPALFLFLIVSCQAQKETYQQLKTRVSMEQTKVRAAYDAADSLGRDSLVTYAREYLFTIISTDFFTHWYGTEWDFNGTTRTPGEGKIACGYFITTVLQDAGFSIPRVYWAQQASEYYITRMTKDIKRFSNKPVETITAYFEGREDGLYIVGLDNHVGFVYKKGKKLQFVHASYYDPAIGVQSEKLNGNNPLAHSGYRVVGRILSDEMVRKWILGTPWEK